MKRIVVDTNVAFSTFLNVNSHIGQILFNSSKHYDFFAPEYIKHELIEHQDRIKIIGKLSDDRFMELYGMIFQNVRTLNHSIIPRKYYETAFDICKDIDIDDTPFVAINNYVRGKLWSGDLRLLNGLVEKGYKRIVTTSELYEDFIQKKNEK